MCSNSEYGVMSLEEVFCDFLDSYLISQIPKQIHIRHQVELFEIFSYLL